MHTRILSAALGGLLLSAAALAGCKAEARTPDSSRGAGSAGAGAGAKSRTLVLGGYTTPREVYGREIIPAFQRYWKQKTGEDVQFKESYLGSGAQARAIAGGFEADVAALSLEPDVETVAKAGLISRDWKAAPHGGMVSRSIVVIGVRAGNPKGVKDWADLRRGGLEVLTPNPKTSGGAMWNVAALYGAAVRGHAGVAANDPKAAEGLLGGVVHNVKIMDKGARESMLTFESGVGDAIITYENEVLVARQAGKTLDYIVPRSTILIENPVAVVDTYADKHGVRDLADAFVAFLATPDVQRMYAKYGLRAVDDAVAAEGATALPAVTDLFTIRDLGGWPVVTQSLFAAGGAWERATSRPVAAR